MINKNTLTHRSSHLSAGVCIFALCLMLLPFDLLSFLHGSASANSDNMVEYDLGAGIEAPPSITSEDAQETVWQANITPAQEQQEKIQKTELQSLINQINAMQLSLPSQSSEPAHIEEVPVVHESENAAQDKNPVATSKSTNSNGVLIEPVTQPTIRKLRQIAQKPEEIDNPYEIGNTLYLSNCIGEAAAFYKETLRRNKPDDISSSDDRAWLLFQTGKSLQSVDMAEAADVYKKLITEFPSSPWADIARVQSNLIAWYTQDKPEELIAQYKH